jgi:hypothetical protein
MILPPHQRAHGSWGGSRVYQKIMMVRRVKTIDVCKVEHINTAYPIR